MADTIFITTPIYYINARPHIGNAYTTIAADTLARYHRQQGRDAFLLTGTDEHGINNERTARAAGLDPAELATEFGADALRYWLLSAIPFGSDGDFTREAFIARVNADLANGFGNLVQRAVALVGRYTGRIVPALGEGGPAEERLRQAAAVLPHAASVAFERLALDEAAAAAMDLVAAANRYAEETAPWHVARAGDRPGLALSLAHLTEAARLAAWWPWPVIPTTGAEAHRRLSGREPEPGLGVFGTVPAAARVLLSLPLVPRLAG